MPLDVGLRLTHQDPKRRYGGLLVRQRATDSSPVTDYGVARYSQNLGKQSRLGGMLTYRNDAVYTVYKQSIASNQNYTATLDGLYRPSQRINVGFMASGSVDSRLGNGLAAQGLVAYRDNLLYIGLFEFFVKNYHPGIGLERFGRDYVLTSPAIEFDIRPKWLPRWLRTFEPDASVSIFNDPTMGRLISLEGRLAPFDVTFQSGANLEVSFEPNVQVLNAPDDFVGAAVGAGQYRFVRTNLGFNTDFSKKLAGAVAFSTGAYYDGWLNSWSLSGRLAPVPHLEFSVDYTYNQFQNLGLARQTFTTHLLGLNTRLALNPRVQLIGFFQRNSAIERNIWNLRLAWEYRPLSYVYLVFNENTTQPGVATSVLPSERLRQQQVIGKLTYLKQF